MSRRALAVAAGVAGDMAVGEPPFDPHPVAAFGALMRGAERRLYRDRRSSGVVHATLGTVAGAAAGTAVGSTAVATYLAAAPRALWQAAQSVDDALSAGDLESARRRLPALVGREPNGLDDKEIARAVVESLAENTVDAVVAPALWALVAGAPGVLGYRAVNTLDATVGHLDDRYRRYGWASARLDDLANFVPARVTALLVAVVRPRTAGSVWRVVRAHAPAHPSPNAGVAESAFAVALGLRLGGTNRYGDRIEVRPSLGWGRVPEPADIAPALRLSRDVTRCLVAGLGIAGVLA